MRYALKDYQLAAVRQVLAQLETAHDLYRKSQLTSQFSLSAATGSGKTVMAAAVIEALFFGNEDLDFLRDPGAVVLWFSDDPSLNEQSRARIHSASPELGARMTIVETNFAETKLRPGNVYFLNTHKLAKNSRLVRGVDWEADNSLTSLLPPPDEYQQTFYDVLSNTLSDPDITLYMFLDEAHRGMGKPAKDRSSIVQRLINGERQNKPIPIVLGISATVERFDLAMKAIGTAGGRVALPPVTVDPQLVQESGLLKDDIVLEIPSESGTFDTVLLRRGVEKLRRSTYEWAEYAREQHDGEPVLPLMVVQVPDKSGRDVFTRIWDTIYEAWPELPTTAFAHVFGEHSDIPLGQFVIPYVEPQRVQEQKNIRILLAKTAISTGWDCPRAEVLVSFRPAVDHTHITQLLGRMIRTPLARRIPGNELLNSVDCLLPFFERKTAEAVVKALVSGGDAQSGVGAGKRVLFDPVLLHPNANIDPAVFEAFAKLPSLTIPKVTAKPIPRCTAIAAALAKDGVVEGCVAKTYAKLCAALDGRAVQYAKQVDAARQDVLTMNGEEIRTKVGSAEVKSSRAFSVAADTRAINDSYRSAGRSLSKQLCAAYVDHLVPFDEDDDKLLDAHVRVAALGAVPEIVKDIEAEANKIASELLDSTRVARKNLRDADQAIYDHLEAQASTPQLTELLLPREAQVDTRVLLKNGSEENLPTDNMHLLADENGEYPFKLNEWERHVLCTEKSRSGFKGWYRNPSRGGQDSLCIPYEDDGWKALRPDFIFFADDGHGGVAVDIVDPHGYHLADALPKLRGFVKYVRNHAGAYRRVEAVAVLNDGRLRVLDITKTFVQEAILEAETAQSLYSSAVAYDYQ
ncbi:MULTISPECIES: DEAD/DEAH box helicase [Actinotignum]|uniref:DEAD/DEAH box helicase n=1 Tax=Actinotignum TaxID=1653174 RepID=UPI00254B1659|nr:MULTISPECIES: DEAD/DEAH box helicase family protein [Actinotignum]MDK7272331.1 DEAD/DEAH box helicase family protein [Actinotignum schaalii]MDY5145167.1 DEAD/DEAH box helicase family protein [Actinotignum timonense]